LIWWVTQISHIKNGRLCPWTPQSGLPTLPTCTCTPDNKSSCALDNGIASLASDGNRDGQLTLAQYLTQEKYSTEFIYKVLLPALAGIHTIHCQHFDRIMPYHVMIYLAIIIGICTCTYQAVLAYPAFIIIHYVITRSMRGVRRAQGGAQAVVDQLSKYCTAVNLNVAVDSIRSNIVHGKRVVTVRDSNVIHHRPPPPLFLLYLPLLVVFG
jgi:hypothetical protein